MSKPDDDEFKKMMFHLQQSVNTEMVPQMKASRFVMGVVPPQEHMDVFMLLQIGAAVLLGKPLILISVKGAFIPARARQVADAVIEVDSMTTPEAQAKLQKVITDLIAKQEKEERPQ